MDVRRCARTRALAGLAAIGIGVAAPAAGQDYDTSVGWGGGWMRHAPFVEAGDATPRDIGLRDGWVALLQLESWQLGRWVGVRAAGHYAYGPLQYPTDARSISSWGLDGALLLRVVPPTRLRYVTAYLIGGGGATWYRLGDEDVPTVVDGSSIVLYDPAERRQWTAHGGLGLEYLSTRRVGDGLLGLRLEAVDVVRFGSPFRIEDGAAQGATHNPRVSFSMFTGVPRFF